NNKLSQRRTGGGPCAKPLSTVSEKIIDIYKDSPTFTGLSGFETQAPDESIEILGSPQTVCLLTELLNPSDQPKEGEQVVDELSDLAKNVVTVEAEVHVSAAEKPTTAMTSMEPNMSKKVGDIGQRKRVKHEDVTQMQYAVLVEQQLKLREQTEYYRLMNKKLRRELDMSSED
ncbi:uncharacterized protein LOC134246343, partial [Saccostrea cucullata]|uniref:uncharacterized protein LOC134246343 n=1 Tax=Saccostrea cuccullata TaxID=36930 RepID=UPI002ED65687